jgi:hypothetical protein
MRKQEHHYEVYELKDGFKIVPSEEDRPPVVFKMNKRGFWYNVDKQRKLQYGDYQYIPLYAYYPLLDGAIEKIYETWNPEKKTNNPVREMVVTTYCKRTTGKTLNKKVHEIWKRKRDSLDPVIVQLHKKLFSISKGTGNWDRIDRVLRRKKALKYLIDDMLKYPAARTAILHAYGVNEYDLIHDWKTAYAKDGKLYTSLNKTLMNFPNGVVYYNALSLKFIKLPEPVSTRIRMYAYAMVGRSYSVRTHNSEDKIMHILLKSSDEDIKEAIRYMWHYFPNTYTGDFRKVKGIEHALTLIFDYPASLMGDWDIIGLCKRSEVYQHDLELQERIRQQEYEAQRLEWQERSRQEREKWEREQRAIKLSKTALPPIPLPEEEYIGFLDDYRMVVQEGVSMHHCIASYAESAVKGNCYLFHVNYDGEQASVEVNPSGFVNQSYGPKDTINKASEYGRKVLGSWARKLTTTNKKPILRIEDNPEVLNTCDEALEESLRQLDWAGMPF